MNSKNIKCPECGKDTIEKDIGADLMLRQFRYISIQILVCMGCDWMTVSDWDRTETTDIVAWLG